VFNTLRARRSLSLSTAKMDAGYHEIQFNASNLASGVYFIESKLGATWETRKLCLIR